MSDAELARTIEHITADTWPAIEQWSYDGWVLRFARGYTKRANSVTTLERGRRVLPSKIAACEATYEARHIPAVFRLPSTADVAEVDAALAERGYGKADKTSIRIRDLSHPLRDAGAQLEIAPTLTAPWFDPVARWNGLDPRQRVGFEAIAGAIREPTAFALLRERDEPVAAGIAVRQRDLVCLHAIITAPEARRRGFGRTLTLGLLHWGRGAGARSAYLQVVKSNAPALRLYNELGFDREIYRYHYRLNPAPRPAR